MKPVKTKDANTRLILPEEEHLPDEKRRGDLPIERLFLIDEETGDQRPGFESTWQPDKGERRALANGAQIKIRLWGANHPPIRPSVGEPDAESMEALVTVEETAVAASKFFSVLSERMAKAESGGEPIEAEEIPPMFQACLKDVVESGRHRPAAMRRNGDGPEEGEE